MSATGLFKKGIPKYNIKQMSQAKGPHTVVTTLSTSTPPCSSLSSYPSKQIPNAARLRLRQNIKTMTN